MDCALGGVLHWPERCGRDVVVVAHHVGARPPELAIREVHGVVVDMPARVDLQLRTVRAGVEQPVAVGAGLALDVAVDVVGEVVAAVVGRAVGKPESVARAGGHAVKLLDDVVVRVLQVEVVSVEQRPVDRHEPVLCGGV